LPASAVYSSSALLLILSVPRSLSRFAGNGEIDLEELSTVMRSLGYAPTESQLKEMMAKVDLDGNGEGPTGVYQGDSPNQRHGSAPS
jgi:hypothetical protein